MNEGISFVHSSEANKAFLLNLMGQLEVAKKTLESQGHNLSDPAHAFNWANKVFMLADEEDRAGNASKKTARSFIAAATFIDVLAQFGNIPAALVERRKYAKFKAADILRCLKQGVKPTPGPPGMSEEEKELERMMAEDAAAEEAPGGGGGEKSFGGFDASSTGAPAAAAVDDVPEAPTEITSLLSQLPSVGAPPAASPASAAPGRPQPAYFPDAYAPSAPQFAPQPTRAPDPADADQWRTAYERERDARLRAEQQLAGLQTQVATLQSQLSRATAAAAAPSSSSLSPTGSTATAGTGATLNAHPSLSEDAKVYAQKHARFVASALQYDDTATALKELQNCLKALCENKF